MAKYNECGHYDEKCPCLDCQKPCGYHCWEETTCAVDTDKLCKRARLYCESDREEKED